MASGKRVRDKLSAADVKALATPGKHGDGGGLWLMISPTGAKRWAMIFRSDGRLREMGLGAYPDVSLAKARKLADDAREQLELGMDPITARNERRAAEKAKAAAEETFGSFCDRWLSEALGGLRSEKHRKQWTATLITYAAPIRGKPIGSIRAVDIVECLSPIWLTKSETAHRTRQRLERVFSAAIAAGAYAGLNPARLNDNLENLLPKRSGPKRVKHHASLPHQEVPLFIADLRKRSAVAALALELVVLGAMRSGEVRLATWREYDREARLLRLPAERTKAGKPFEVPLTDRAIEIIEKARGIARDTSPEAFIFGGERKGRPLSVMAFDMLLRRMGLEVTTHGFRSSFRDWAHEKTSFRREIIEQCLSHTIGNATEQAYLRSTALEQRREIMNAWAAFCEPKAASVVPLHGRKASA